jgi:hypothetical protein
LFAELPAIKFSDSKNAVASPKKAKKVKKSKKVLRGAIKENKISKTFFKPQPRKNMDY